MTNEKTNEILITAMSYIAFVAEVEKMVSAKAFNKADIQFFTAELTRYKRVFSEYNQLKHLTEYEFTEDILLIDKLIIELNFLLTCVSK